MDIGDGNPDGFRHGIAGGFVRFKKFMAESRAMHVECYAKVGWMFKFQDLFKRIDKAENSRSVHSFGVNPRIVDKGKIGTVDKCVCINQK